MHRGDELTGGRRVRFEPRWAARVRYRVGRRGAMLAVLGVIDIIYGAALLDALIAPGAQRWWPASLRELYGIPVPVWGAVWVAVGLFLFTGMPRRWPDWPQFSAAVVLKVWWAFTAFVSAAIDYSPGSWGPGAVYAGFALIVLISAGWEEPR